jgi:hypothetical protein
MAGDTTEHHSVIVNIAPGFRPGYPMSHIHLA